MLNQTPAASVYSYRALALAAYAAHAADGRVESVTSARRSGDPVFVLLLEFAAAADREAERVLELNARVAEDALRAVRNAAARGYVETYGAGPSTSTVAELQAAVAAHAAHFAAFSSSLAEVLSGRGVGAGGLLSLLRAQGVPANGRDDAFDAAWLARAVGLFRLGFELSAQHAAWAAAEADRAAAEREAERAARPRRRAR